MVVPMPGAGVGMIICENMPYVNAVYGLPKWSDHEQFIYLNR